MALGGTVRCPVYTGRLATSESGESARRAVVLHGGGAGGVRAKGNPHYTTI